MPWLCAPLFTRALVAAAATLLTLLGPRAAHAQDAPAAANPFGRKYPARVYQTARLEGKPPAIVSL